jgi:cytochrome b subunit of formate dehydrogenase
LWVHLFFAIPTAVLWIFVIVQALRKFDDPPLPNAYSAQHKFWGWIAAIEMTLTAVTGWAFYYLAFVA